MTFPDDENGGLLAEMHQAGVDLSQPHDVDFFHLFEKKPNAEKMAKIMSEQHPEAKVVLEEDDTPGVWDVNCTISVVPSHDNISQLEKTYEVIAEKCEGYADGWGILA